MASGVLSYAAALTGDNPAPAPLSNMFPQRYHDTFALGVETGFLKKASRKNGKPAIFLTEAEISTLAAPCRLFLVGKFLYGNPKLELIRKDFEQMKLKGGWKIGKLDGRHILIQLSNDADYTHLFARRLLRIDNQVMKVLKWTVDFDPRTEPPTIPVWLRFPGLKVHLYDQELFALAMVFGKPLKTDVPTMNLTRPSEARILIERDITLPFSGEIWIDTQHQGFWQQAELEQIPLYCTHCRMFGHSPSQCYHLHPNLKPMCKNATGSAPLHTCPSSAPECIPQTFETPVDTMSPLPPTTGDNPTDVLTDGSLGHPTVSITVENNTARSSPPQDILRSDNQNSIAAPQPQEASGAEETGLPSLQNEIVVTVNQELGAHPLLHARQSVDHADQMSQSSDEE